MMRLTILAIGLVAVCAFNGGNTPSFVDPTEPTLEGVVMANYHEFDRTKKARCAGTPTSDTSACWSDNDGASFRYGCIEGDNRIFTDACGMDGLCGDCEGNWKWGGEQQDVCYDDGKNLYSFTCGEQAPKEEVEVEEEPGYSRVSALLVSTCAELGWPLQPGDLSVCGYSKLVDNSCLNGKKAHTGNFDSAQAMCQALGARLCTVEELNNDETKGTGCKGDCAAVRSSSTCPNGQPGHMTTAGASKCKNKFPPTCVPDSDTAAVRCCADAVAGSATALAKPYPAGFSPAMASDYKITDGGCGKGASIAKYSCWTAPDGNSMRFACHDDNDFIFYQSCGTDAKCSPTSCSGDFRKTNEVATQCYTRPEDGYLYHYHCPGKGSKRGL